MTEDFLEKMNNRGSAKSEPCEVKLLSVQNEYNISLQNMFCPYNSKEKKGP